MQRVSDQVNISSGFELLWNRSMEGMRLVDSFGNTLSGSYRGRLPYVNASGGSYPVSGLKSISSKIQDLIRKQ